MPEIEMEFVHVYIHALQEFSLYIATYIQFRNVVCTYLHTNTSGMQFPHIYICALQECSLYISTYVHFGN